MNKKGQSAKIFTSIIIFVALLFMMSKWLGTNFISDEMDSLAYKKPPIPVKNTFGTDWGDNAKLFFDILSFKIEGMPTFISDFFNIVIPLLLIYVLTDILWIG